ncbi:MAG TPA: DUF308 domain-containing protein [Planctomycetota bacterium]|nr:DUF308 domain-containing protein [Planctomycetota bacterium]
MSFAEDVRESLTTEVRRSSSRMIALGIVAIALGGAGLAYANVMTVTSIFVFGSALVMGGVVHIYQAAKYRDMIGLMHDLPVGLFQTVVGALLLSKPGASVAGLTLITAALLIVVGIHRTILAAAFKPPSWGWAVASGLASILLGGMTWREWPSSSLWLLGSLVSAYLLVSGWSYLMFGLAVRKELGGIAPQPAT